MILPVLVGPTAVGKTELAVRIASEIGAEIVSADSRQIYRFMDIGTAKPTREELSVVKHHMIDIADPDEHFGAGQYRTLALSVLNKLAARGKLPLVVGGSGLYIRSLVEGFFPAPAVDEDIRRRILKEAEECGTEPLHRRLREVDPEAARRIHPNDLQRISRALEVYEQTGTPISRLQNGAEEGAFEPLYVGLRRDRRELHVRVESRLDRMMRMGFLDEVEGLIDRGYSTSLNSFRAVGYREMAAHLSGELTLVEATAKTSKRTKAFARRQLTWFRKLEGVTWIDLSTLSEREASSQILLTLRERLKYC
jgi:tRNA dimethylallyltransferase